MNATPRSPWFFAIPHPLLGRVNCAGVLLAAASALTLLVGCNRVVFGNTVTGSGQIVTKEYDYSDFSKVNAGNAFQIVIKQGTSYHVDVSVDDNLLEHLDIRKDGETLRIQLKPNLNLRDVTLKANVTMPELKGLKLSGATHTTIKGFSSDKPLDVDVSGASQLKGEIRNGDARLNLSGASKIELTGQAAKLKVHASGASRADLNRYQAIDTDVDASGASHVIVHVNGHLGAEASGASSVRYQGQPTRVETHTSGASSVRKQ